MLIYESGPPTQSSRYTPQCTALLLSQRNRNRIVSDQEANIKILPCGGGCGVLEGCVAEVTWRGDVAADLTFLTGFCVRQRLYESFLLRFFSFLFLLLMPIYWVLSLLMPIEKKTYHEIAILSN